MKTAIITRAFNRLEYTAMNIREVYRLAGTADYEHIIIDQNSSDGTGDFLRSLEIEGFYKIKVKYNKENTGDAGGMRDGFNIISDDCEYVLQLDNDLIPLTDDFINKLVYAMETYPKIGAIMLKREGVGHVLEMGEIYCINDGVKYYHMPKLHGMFFRVEHLKKLNHWANKEAIGWVKQIPNLLNGLGYITVKTPDIKVWHADTTGGQGQRFHKLNSGRVAGSNFKNFNYKEYEK